MELNKPLIRKMIKRIGRVPESYDQSTWGATFRASNFESPRPRPACGTTACLAGQALICAAKTELAGACGLLRRTGSSAATDAAELLGLSEEAKWKLFWGDEAQEWPEPFRTQYRVAKTYKGEARAAIRLLKAILKTNGAILES